ncbi:MAG: serine/threonine protein kinase [Candidatus Sericytochromatia bacterium]|nr:serine/threonine protein kinase [Candidatus Sericytochromatia bacterium]
MPLQIQADVFEALEANYIIEREAGRGGMGVVYQARDRRLERPVAIKVLHLSQKANDSLKVEIIERFQREARVVAGLSHPNLVTLYDVGQAGDYYYMIMEFAEGKTLSELVEAGRQLPPALVASIAHQTCLALAAAHDKKIIHRDIKPGNLILSPKGQVKLTDFGIAQLNQQNKGRLTQAGAVMGSILYASPEQLKDASSVDLRSDIYSLGITLFELLTAKSPYQGEQIGQVMLDIMSTQPIPDPASMVPGIPAELARIMLKASAKNREERYASCLDMAQDLAQLLSQQATETTSFQLNFTESGPRSPQRKNLSDTTLLRKTSLDPAIIARLKAKHHWVADLVQHWPQQQLTQLSLSQALDKVTETNLFGQGVSGCLVVAKCFYLLIANGHFVGALDLQSGQRDQAVFEQLPADSNEISLHLAPEQAQFAPLVIGDLLAGRGQVLQSQLDSSLMDLLPLVENLGNPDEALSGHVVCYTHNNIYYYGYDKGQQIFAAAADPEAEAASCWERLDNLVLHSSVLMHIYRCAPQVLGPSRQRLLQSVTLHNEIKDPAASTLQSLCDRPDAEWPVHLVREAKANHSLALQYKTRPELRHGNQRFDLSGQILQSPAYRFADFLLRSYFYQLQASGNTTALKYIYSWIPAISGMDLAQPLQGDDGQQYMFDAVARGTVKGENTPKVLFLIRSGPGDVNSVARFLDEVISVKKQLIKTGDIGGAMYLSNATFEAESLKLFYARTVEPRKKALGLGTLDKLTRYKGFVRIGMNRGFHLNLFECPDQGFELVAPTLK